MRGVALILGWCLLPAVVGAHPLAPASFTVTARGHGQVDVQWRSSTRGHGPMSLRTPPTCKVHQRSPMAVHEPGVLAGGETWVCEGPELYGQTLVVEGLRDSGNTALVKVVHPRATVVQALLHAQRRSFVVPAASVGGWDYLALGVQHLWQGLDHVLFILALLLVVKGWRAMVLALTAFTLGHSFTLALAVLGLVRLPPALVEVAIALSLVWMASIAVLRHRHASLEETREGTVVNRRWEAPLAMAFGLVHGLGFAAVLQDVGLPPDDTLRALLLFNVGIEVGQLALVSLGGALAWMVGWVRMGERAVQVVHPWLAYGVGSLAATWVLERSLVFL